MNDERRARIKKRLAAITSSRWTMRMLSDPNEEEIHFIANAPADIRDLLADNAALEQELARALAALGKLEPDYVASDEDGDYCEWCGSDSGHVDDCVFAVIAKDEEEE